MRSLFSYRNNWYQVGKEQVSPGRHTLTWLQTIRSCGISGRQTYTVTLTNAIIILDLVFMVQIVSNFRLFTTATHVFITL